MVKRCEFCTKEITKEKAICNECIEECEKEHSIREENIVSKGRKQK